MLDDSPMAPLRALDLHLFHKALRDAVIGALACRPDLRLEQVRVQRRKFLPARGLRLVDAEVGELRGSRSRRVICDHRLCPVSRSFRAAISISSSPARRSARILISVAWVMSVVSFACFA